MILLVGLMLRVWYLADFSKGPDFAAPGVDAEFHDYWARALATGDWTPPANTEDPCINSTPYLRPPGYPYFLAAVYRVLGDSYFAPRFVQILMGLASAVVAYLIGRRWFGGMVGLVAAALLSCYWAFIYFEAEFHAPVLMIFITLLELYALGRFAEKPSWKSASVAGVLFGLSALVLPNVLLFGPVAAIWMLLRCRSIGTPRRRMTEGVLAFGIGAALAISPATIRNYRVSGEFVPITTNAGINLYIGNHEGAAGFCLVEIPELGKFETCFDYPALVRALEAKLGRKLSTSEVDAWFRDQAMKYITSNPGRFVSLTWTKALMFWGPSELSHNKEVQLERDYYAALRVSPLDFAAILASAVVGGLLLVLCGRSTRPPGRAGRKEPANGTALHCTEPGRSLALLMAAFVFVFFLSILPFFNAARYRVPIIPFMMFFSAIAIAYTIDAARGRKWRQGAAVIVGASAFCLMTMAWPFKFEPDRSNWHYARGYCFAKTNRIDAAIAEYESAIAVSPDNAKAHFNLGVLLQQKGDAAGARRHFDAVAAGDAYVAEAQLARARVLFNEGRLDDAAAEYETLLRSQPNHHDALIALALIRAQQSRLDESLQLYEAAVAAKPESTTALYEMGMTLAGAGRAEDAASAYRRALSLDPEFFEARNNLAALYVQMNRLDDAVALFREAVRIRPDSREARLNLAFVLTKMGRHADAADVLSNWLADHPDDAEAHLRIGQALAAAGRGAEAKPHFEAVLRAHPGNEAAVKGLAEIGKSP